MVFLDNFKVSGYRCVICGAEFLDVLTASRHKSKCPKALFRSLPEKK